MEDGRALPMTPNEPPKVTVAFTSRGRRTRRPNPLLFSLRSESLLFFSPSRRRYDIDCVAHLSSEVSAGASVVDRQGHKPVGVFEGAATVISLGYVFLSHADVLPKLTEVTGRWIHLACLSLKQTTTNEPKDLARQKSGR